MTQRREEISPLLDKYKKDPNITDKDGKDPGSTRQIDENGQSRDMGANWAGIFPPRLRETGRSNILVAFHPRTLLGIPGVAIIYGTILLLAGIGLTFRKEIGLLGLDSESEDE